MIALDDLTAATRAETLVSGPHATFDGFAHDSRIITPGECFVAVRGVRGDGHDFVLDAIERGATGVLVERPRIPAIVEANPDLLEKAMHSGTTVLTVADAREALRLYAAYVLKRWNPTVVAVTGATGKTTTKEAIADVLSTVAPTFRSWRNYNDLLGMPLSLGRLEPAHQFAVLELGADHPGEIAQLCSIAGPSIGVVTNVSAAHLEYFDDVEALRDELGKLPASLPTDGMAVLNGDDSAVSTMSTAARRLLFGLQCANSDEWEHMLARFELLPLGTRVPLALALRSLDSHTALPGSEAGTLVFPELHADHWAYAILAALTVGQALGVPLADAASALLPLQPLPGRLRWLNGIDGLTLLDDSHNATPASAHAGLAALDSIGRACSSAIRIAVLGDMLHLGESEVQAHRNLGREVVSRADYLVTRGVRAELIADEARAHGMPSERIAMTHTAEDAAGAARGFAREASAHEGPQAVVYVKGSEDMRMEQVSALLLAQPKRAEEFLDRQTQAWRRVVVMRPDRPTWLEVDLSAIGGNTRRIKDLVGPRVQVLVSLKADAYGHGALRVARTVLHNGASWLGVATVSEAEPLRSAGVDAPILIFGYIAPWQAREAIRLDVLATVYALDAARALSRAATDLGREVRVHVKVDTGMARLGLRAEDPSSVVAFCEQLRTMPGLRLEGIFTHFATADSADQTYARRQLDRFQTVLAALDSHGLRPELVHAANSAATLTLPDAHFDMVRPGIAIYGLPPSSEVRLPEGFRPALAFKTQVAQVKDIPAGEGISYGATYVTDRTTRIAVLPVGYADGFRRGPTNWGEVLVRGKRAPLVGRVCMDQSMIDVTAIPGVRQGDEVVLIGRQGDDELTAEAVAQRLGTICYEVVAELLARVPRMS